MANDVIEQQARMLASENRNAEPDIERVLWFPSDDEVWLVGVIKSVPKTEDGQLHPFYFRANAKEDLPAPSGVALIRPEEVGTLRLPERWGDWDKAVPLDDAE